MLGTMMTVFVTSHDKVTNTVIIVSDITWQGYKYCHHCTQHHMTRLQILSSLYLTSLARLQILSSLYPTLHDKVTNTVIIVPDITWQGYKYCHHCTWHHMKRLQILSLYLISLTRLQILYVRYYYDCICYLVMWCQVQWWLYL
jgi:hypothetical protein